jgi:hypothetical protein
VVAAPLVVGSFSGSVTVSSNDPDTPQVVVALTADAASAIPGESPDIVLEPSFFDFGSVETGCEAVATFWVGNQGTVVGEVQQVLLDAEQMELVDPLEDGFLIYPGEEIPIEVRYRPKAPGVNGGTLSVRSDDPDGDAEVAALAGEGLGDMAMSQTFLVGDYPALTVLFAVDQSCSMQPHKDNLIANLNTFIEEVSQPDVEWRLGVVTEDDGCLNGGILDPNSPTLVDQFTTAVQTHAGTKFFTEALIGLGHRAMEQSRPGGCNEGLLQPGGLLHLVVVSDEPEQSRDTMEIVSLMEEKVGAPGLLRISGAVDQSRLCPFASGAAGYVEAIAETGGVLLEVCDPAWGTQMTQVAEVSLDALTFFVLHDLPQPGSIEVRVDGLLYVDWVYLPSSNSIELNQEKVPGQTVEVRYLRQALCR